MKSAAKITSVDVLKDFKGSLAKFCDEAKQALCAIEMDARRVLDWLQYDQMARWTRQLRRRQEDVLEARTDLNRVKLARAAGQKVDMIEQREALQLAQNRVKEAEEKIEGIRRWVRILDRGIDEYQGQAQQLQALVEGDPPQAVLLLERMIDALDSYLRVAPMSVKATQGGPGEGVKG